MKMTERFWGRKFARRATGSIWLVFVLLGISMSPCYAEVVGAAADGFQLELNRETDLDSTGTFELLVTGFGKWWDADHSYSGKSENLSMDIERQCMYERLPNRGFVRHMEIVFYQPGEMLRLTGGLGPLQEMGVKGTLVFKVTSSGASHGTRIQLQYTVVGFSQQQLDKLAPVVDQVLSGQLDRLKQLCHESL